MCVLVLNDLSALNISMLNKHVIFAGLAAAKKLIATRWKPLPSLLIKVWTLSFLDVVCMTLSTARVSGADKSHISTWDSTAGSLKEIM